MFLAERHSLVVAGTSQSSHGRAGLGLLLLGLGWSACLVAGSTLISESVPDDVADDLAADTVATVADAVWRRAPTAS